MNVTGFFLFVFSLHAAHAAVSYDGFSVYKIEINDESDALRLKNIVARFPENQVKLWSDLSVAKRSVLFHVAPEVISSLSKLVSRSGLRATRVMEDLQSAIDHHRADNDATISTLTDVNGFGLDKYHTFQEIDAWLYELDKFYDIANVFEIATSFQGTPIHAIKISTLVDVGSNRPAIWIDGGIHAREWVSPATMVFFINFFLENYNKIDLVTDILQTFDLYILPVFNPDGYEYTWTEDRLWRKTRSDYGNSRCIGADPNRNFDFHWNSVGTSPFPCSDRYAGVSPFSEIEVKSVAEFVGRLKPKAFLSYHSYSQFFMLPNGYTTDPAPDFEELMLICEEANKLVFNVHQERYKCDSLSNLVGLNSGSSADYMYGVQNITYTYGIELRDTGEHGFLLPANQIVPTAEEQLPFLLYLAKYIMEHDL